MLYPLRRLLLAFAIVFFQGDPSVAFSIQLATLSRLISPALPISKNFRSFSSTRSSESSECSSPDNQTSALKKELLTNIKNLRSLQERDGDFSIDFGVKGGELDKKSRAPQKVDFYSISDDVGNAADEVMGVASQLAECNPTNEPTIYFGDKTNGGNSPLDGTWRLLFTTAADATFSKSSKRGAATAKNVVDASKGRITNVIDFATLEDGTEPLLKQLNVVIGAKSAGKSRVELQFKYAKAVLTKFFFWKRQWSVYIPVPAPFITRSIVFFSRILKFGRQGEVKVPPKAYFDVLYLDEDLRIHKTGEDNLFVQASPAWEEAQPFLS
mmetsp:Transcript_13640/g.27795  ORF Transcript_13640/g.27795 Transcript_13640/m.27795 type:complete len:326 (-) Transcript_13640:93-1070(-)